jgi:hypothetical protein
MFEDKLEDWNGELMLTDVAVEPPNAEGVTFSSFD